MPEPVAAGATRALLRQDARRLRRHLQAKFGYAPVTWFLDPAWLCVLLYRLSHRAWLRGHGVQARLWMQVNSLLTGADFQPAAAIGGGLLVPSPAGVNVSGRAGENLVLLALAGMGGNTPDKDVGAGPGLPLLGRDIMVGQFSGIQGSIVVGDGTVFEAASGVVASVPAGSRMAREFDPQPGALPPVPPPHPPAPPCGHARWRQTWADWRADLDRTVQEQARFTTVRPRHPFLGIATTNPALALLAYRVSHFLALSGWGRLARLVFRGNLLLHKLTIPPAACLGGGVLLPHLSGVVFHGRTGTAPALFASALCSCTGNAAVLGTEHAPVLGDAVMVGGHGGIFGPVRLGDRVQIGPKSQVAADVADDRQVYDPMARGTVNKAELPMPAVEDGAPRTGFPLPADRPWTETWARMRRDRQRLDETNGGRRAPGFPALTCVWLFRLAHGLRVTGWRRLSRWCCLLNTALTGADISPLSEIGAGLVIPHPAGVALHGCAGPALTVMALGGMGALLDAEDRLMPLAAAPHLGEGVTLGHHSGVYGAVVVGDGVTVMPGGIVTRPVPPGQVLLPRPLRVRDRIATERARVRAALARSGG